MCAVKKGRLRIGRRDGRRHREFSLTLDAGREQAPLIFTGVERGIRISETGWCDNIYALLSSDVRSPAKLLCPASVGCGGSRYAVAQHQLCEVARHKIGFLAVLWALAAHAPAMISQLALLSRPYFSGNTELLVGIAKAGQVDIR